MQIIGGKYRNRKLKTLNGLDTRPTLTRIKKNMFNIIDNYFIYQNKIGLDLFAGSGSLGIEALSRGLSFCYFNDQNLKAIKIINDNLQQLQPTTYLIENLSYLDLLQKLQVKNIKFDLILLDPPFENDEVFAIIINFVIANNMLNKYGMIICETNRKLNLNLLPLLVCKKYQHIYLYFFRNE